jgi:large subunit ribosomal protein L10
LLYLNKRIKELKMSREDKAKVVEELKGKFSRSKSFFLTDFRGLNVEEITGLRKDLRIKGVDYRVAKNTLIRLAAKGLSLDSVIEHLEGSTGIAFSYEDPVTPAKVLYELNKKLNKPKIKIFWVEGKFFKGEELEKLAKLPPKEILYAQIIASLDSGMRNLIGSLDGILREFVGTLDAIINSKKEN